MTDISAFVGHSFMEDDASVVRTFLDYFGKLKDAVPGFTWVHAEAAQPRELAEKILTLIEGRNVFIGICTAKEFVAEASAVKPMLLSRDHGKIKFSDLQNKTSDWLIQEIGLAIGRGMSLLLIVERGVRPPGGLQGNIEYIEFERDRPEKSFNRILEMITALSPKASGTSAPPESALKSTAAEQLSVSDDAPKPDWEIEEYQSAMLRTLLGNDDAALDTLSAAFLKSSANKDSEATAVWNASIEYWKVIIGKGGSLAQLKQIAEQHPRSPRLLVYLARALVEYEHYDESASKYLEAAESPDSGEKAVYYRTRAAVQYQKAGKEKQTLQLMNQIKEELDKQPQAEKDFLDAIREIGELKKDEDIQIFAMERIVEIVPDDFQTRFNLAYKHGELGNTDMAFYHYLMIPFDGRTAITWNNLGVSYDQFKMPYNSVKAYRISEEKGETLAMSNLAQKFMKAGFLKEADEEFVKARKIDDYHKNVDRGSAQWKEIPDEEEKARAEVLEKAKPKAEFYRLLGNSIGAKQNFQVASKWQCRECELTLTIVENNFRATGNYEEATNALAVGLFGGATSSRRYEIEYEGVVQGRTIEGTVKRKRLDGATANSVLSLIGDGTTKVLIVLLDGDRELRVAENPYSLNPSFYSIVAL